MSSFDPLDGDDRRGAELTGHDASGSRPHRLEPDDVAPFSYFDEPRAAADRGVVPVPGTDRLSDSTVSRRLERQTSHVRGVSVAAVLQMLHLERKTCELAVRSGPREATLALVDGELVDASTHDLRGEPAVYRVLTWPHPEITILDRVERVQRSVHLPLSVLIVESIRRQDENAGSADASGSVERPRVGSVDVRSDGERVDAWARLAETLVIDGALLAAVIDAPEGRVLALADESGRVPPGAASPAAGEVLPGIRAIEQWSRFFSAAVEEIVVRIDGRHLLLQPLDAERSLFVIAHVDSPASLDPIRRVIATGRG